MTWLCLSVAQLVALFPALPISWELQCGHACSPSPSDVCIVTHQTEKSRAGFDAVTQFADKAPSVSDATWHPVPNAINRSVTTRTSNDPPMSLHRQGHQKVRTAATFLRAHAQPGTLRQVLDRLTKVGFKVTGRHHGSFDTGEFAFAGLSKNGVTLSVYCEATHQPRSVLSAMRDPKTPSGMIGHETRLIVTRYGIHLGYDRRHLRNSEAFESHSDQVVAAASEVLGLPKTHTVNRHTFQHEVAVRWGSPTFVRFHDAYIGAGVPVIEAFVTPHRLAKRIEPLESISLKVGSASILVRVDGDGKSYTQSEELRNNPQRYYHVPKPVLSYERGSVSKAVFHIDRPVHFGPDPFEAVSVGSRRFVVLNTYRNSNFTQSYWLVIGSDGTPSLVQFDERKTGGVLRNSLIATQYEINGKVHWPSGWKPVEPRLATSSSGNLISTAYDNSNGLTTITEWRYDDSTKTFLVAREKRVER